MMSAIDIQEENIDLMFFFLLFMVVHLYFPFYWILKAFTKRLHGVYDKKNQIIPIKHRIMRVKRKYVNVNVKNSTYGRHQLSQPMRILGPIQFWRGCVIYLYKRKEKNKKKTPPPPSPAKGLLQGGGGGSGKNPRA